MNAHPRYNRAGGAPCCAPARALAVLLLLAGAGMATAQTARDRASDTLIKAAFLHKFASFVEWPEGSFASTTSPLRIGVLGDDDVFRDLADTSRDRDRDGRPVQALRLAPGDALNGYHILYMKGSNARLAEWLAPRARSRAHRDRFRRRTAARRRDQLLPGRRPRAPGCVGGSRHPPAAAPEPAAAVGRAHRAGHTVIGLALRLPCRA
jgi:hypothetical protein